MMRDGERDRGERSIERADERGPARLEDHHQDQDHYHDQDH
ncbi:MAG: hypothetical protein N3G75_09145 [Methanothrix sp.]|nr:hypothetical protein [Methanothrix sp.]MCX8207973.1 hypothetical protein [Methanothrix sp.]